MADRELGRILTLIGAILGILSGIFFILAGAIGGALVTASNYTHMEGFSVPFGASIMALVILGIIQIIVAYGMIEFSRNNNKRDHVMNGIIIIILSVILFAIGGGFVIGPVLAFVGGLLILL